MQNSINDKSSIRILGLMTGSSADGLDVCLVEFSGSDNKPSYNILFSSEVEYPSDFKTAFRNPLDLDDEMLPEYDRRLGMWFAEEISKLNLEFDMIASHGQTIKHEPPYFTLQIGDPSFMANNFNVPVVYDFRTADIKAGGQGAPLIPIVDRYLFENSSEDVLSLNIGGIANISIIPATVKTLPVLAWDTGPGNTLIDKAVRAYTDDKLAYDPEGRIAAEGKLNHKLLDYLLQHEFYQLTPPRSAGQEQFGKTYFNEMMKQFYPETQQQFKDLIMTLTVLTAKTISESIIKTDKNYYPKKLFVSGGGAKNKTLLSLIQHELPHIELSIANVKGVTEDNKEAFGFAFLAYCRLRNIPGNLPSVTGARREVLLGEIFSPGDKYTN